MNDGSGPGPTAEELERWLAELVSSVVDVPVARVELDARFDRYGIDSAAAISLTAEIEKHLGRELDPTLLYDFPTIRALARHLGCGRDG